VGEGAVPPRPGPDRGDESLRRPAAHAWRLQRGSLLGWTIALAVLGAIYGAAADSIADILRDSPQLEEIFENLGGAQTLTDTFFAAAIGIIALVATAYSIRSVLKLKDEEDSLRAEQILATGTPRFDHAWSHLLYGVIGPALMLTVAALAAGATYGLIVDDIGAQVPRVLAAAMVQLPAVWVVTGVAMALYGLAPNLSSLSWGVLAVFLILGQLGQILQFPQWTLNLSPFSHVPMIPAEDFVITPFLVLLAIAVALTAVGLGGFRGRDIPAA
jgi:ABC-2 type transport system permease protein